MHCNISIMDNLFFSSFYVICFVFLLLFYPFKLNSIITYIILPIQMKGHHSFSIQNCTNNIQLAIMTSLSRKAKTKHSNVQSIMNEADHVNHSMLCCSLQGSIWCCLIVTIYADSEINGGWRIFFIQFYFNVCINLSKWKCNKR